MATATGTTRGRKPSEARASLDLKKLAGIIKKNPGKSEKFYSEESGIPMNLIGKAIYQAELIADPSLAIKPTATAVVKARDKDKLRWPRIAARAGVSEAVVKALYQEGTGVDPGASYIGRGRNFATSPAAGGTGRGKAAAKKAQPTKATGTSGRRGKAVAAKPNTRGKAKDPS